MDFQNHVSLQDSTSQVQKLNKRSRRISRFLFLWLFLILFMSYFHWFHFHRDAGSITITLYMILKSCFLIYYRNHPKGVKKFGNRDNPPVSIRTYSYFFNSFLW